MISFEWENNMPATCVWQLDSFHSWHVSGWHSHHVPITGNRPGFPKQAVTKDLQSFIESSNRCNHQTREKHLCHTHRPRLLHEQTRHVTQLIANSHSLSNLFVCLTLSCKLQMSWTHFLPKHCVTRDLSTLKMPFRLSQRIFNQINGGARVFATRVKRLCCRPHPRNQISNWHSYG